MPNWKLMRLGSALVLLSSLALLVKVASAQSVKDVGGGAACSSCHTQIVNSYAQTAMAHASGPAMDQPIMGTFFHRQSGVTYRIHAEDGKLWLDFSRGADPKLEGRRELLYYIGSARLKGRTYLFQVDGFLFESPINWYAQQRLWDMTPNYQAVREAPLNLPAFPECLNCHTSGMQPPVSGTANRYPDPPFSHGGVTCERCHGSAADHVANGKKMLRLAQLPASRRDAICMQCHLEGNVALERPGKHAYEFRPGDDLSDFVRYFVFANKRGTRAVSQFEALAQSACKRASGEKMTCTTCHDPHRSPDANAKVDYYRGKCIACHGQAFAHSHHPENPNCVECHMPALSAKDITHTQSTDHRILRNPGLPPKLASESDGLSPFPDSAESNKDVRDLGLAYETLMERGDTVAGTQAERLLSEANKQDPNDVAVLTALGYVAQEKSNFEDAKSYYEAALRSEPEAADAAANLAAAYGKAGHLRDAVALWQRVFKRAPWRSNVGLDIALGYCTAGKYEVASSYVNRVLEFNPDSGAARALLARLRANPPECSLKEQLRVSR